MRVALLLTLALTGCATSYDRWQAVQSERGLYAWATCVERAGLAAADSAAQQTVRPVDEQALVVPGNWLLTTALTACEGVDRQARAALTPAQTVRLRRDAARAIQSTIIAERANMEAGIL